MDNGVQHHGIIGNISTVISIITAIASFLAQNYAIITVPCSVVAAIMAIRYYNTATNYYKNKTKNNGQSEH